MKGHKTMAIIFLFLLIPCVLAKAGFLTLSRVLFFIFILIFIINFMHHITDKINIQL
jgi:hypothetical protein